MARWDPGTRDPSSSTILDPLATIPTLPRGAVVADRFEIEAPAGSGGMSTVYRARDRSTGYPVALKILHDPAAAPESQLADRFTLEAEILAGLSHPGIAGYVAHGATPGGERYLAMEWLEGETLSDRLRRAPMRIQETIVLGLAVASALGAIHARGAVHRDIKPSNLFLVDGDSARVKVLDLGIVRVARDGPALTATGSTLGTPSYMAPEQARGLKDLDARVDVFALGCVLYECLARRRPFPGDDPIAVLTLVLIDDPPPVRQLRPAVPSALDALIGAMLGKRPGDRPASGDAVAAVLASIGPVDERAAPPPSAPAAVVGPGPAASEERRAPQKRTPLVLERAFTGRDRELRELVGAATDAFAEPCARAAVVLGPAGMGKSRLAHELERELRERFPRVEVLRARGEPETAGSPVATLARAVTGAPPEWLASPLPPDAMRRAFVAWIAAACADHPVALLIDDLQWGDPTSYQLADAALADLPSAPLLVVGFGRRETQGLFPKLWADRAAMEIPLKPLLRRASEVIARGAMGEPADAAALERVLDLAQGNPGHLVDLLRAARAGALDRVPESVLAPALATLGALPEGSRRVLLVASVFGASFWREGITALVGGAGRAEGLDGCLEELAREGVVRRQAVSRYPGTDEYAFRDPLLREAAYLTLAAEDRKLGHALAGEWLESQGEGDALVLADHFARGGRHDRAAMWAAAGRPGTS